MGARNLFSDLANLFGQMHHGAERISDLMGHHVNEPLLLLLTLLRLGRGTLLGQLGLLDLCNVYYGTNEAGVWVVTQRPEQEKPPLASLAGGRHGAPEFATEFFATGECLSVGSHDALVVVRVDALWPRAELVLDLVGGELEEAVVDKDGLGFRVEDGEPVGEQLCEALEQLRLHRVDLLSAARPARLLRLGRLDLSPVAVLRQLVEAPDGHVAVDGGAGEQLGQHALARAGGVEQGAEQELGVALLVGELLQEEVRSWRMSGGCTVQRGRAMLTYLDGAAAQHPVQRAQRLSAVAVVAAGALAVEVTPRLAPGQVVHHREALAPEDGGAVRHGQDARIDEAYQRRRPLVARAERRLGPAVG
jgi:hypothetical protein